LPSAGIFFADLRNQLWRPSLSSDFSGPIASVPFAPKEARMKAILFVDDHEVLARLSCEILEMQGYRAVSAYNGEDALRKFEQEDFDILVTDFRMEGMNGVELARKVHERHPEIPVIIVTGYGPVDGGQDVAACLQKEDLFPALLEKIKMFLGEKEEKPQEVKAS
jgi:DNA-binding NtrC family response regulator